ncbi:unnamed protein product, partial [Heterotrigona itama]
MYSSVEIEKHEAGIPETIEFYNSTKFDVDITDQMARKEELATEYQEEQPKEQQKSQIYKLQIHDWEKCQIRFCKGNKTNKIYLKCEKYVY